MTVLYKNLGNSNLKVSNICLGTMTFGEQTNQNEANDIMDFAFENGINFIDTAEMYPIYPKAETQGLTEKIIGEWMYKKKNRNKLIIASKICSYHPKGIGATQLKWIRGGGKNLRFDKKNFEIAVDCSLKRLKTDYIDLYQLHWPERSVPVFGELDFVHDPEDKDWNPIFDVLQNLENLKKKGKIRHFGISNETAWGMMKYLSISEQNNFSQPVSVQNGYNLINRVFDISNSEISIRENCGLIAYSPLAGGRLTGKYLEGKRPSNARYTLWPGRFSRHHTPRGEKAILKYLEISKKYQLNIKDMANAFVLNRPFVTSSIFGVTSLFQLKENLECLKIKLSKNLLNDLNAVHISDPNPCV